MMRKITCGPIRNKERTKNKILDSISRIIAEEGVSGLNITTIARKADVNIKLIHIYWGGFEGVIADYFNTRPFFEISPVEIDSIVESSSLNFGKDAVYQLLEMQFDNLMKIKEMRGILTYELNEGGKPLKKLARNREELREQIISKITNIHFKDKENKIRAIIAILMGGIYYLTINTHKNNAFFYGINIKEEKGQQELKKAIKQIIDWAYS